MIPPITTRGSYHERQGIAKMIRPKVGRGTPMTIIRAIRYENRVQGIACGVVIVLFVALAVIGILYAH